MRFLVALALLGSLSACGGRAPSSPQAWIQLAESHWFEKGVEVRFQTKMSFRDEEESQLIAADHRGDFAMEGAGRAAVASQTLFTLTPDSASDGDTPTKVVLRNQQVADGESLWVQTEYPDGRVLVTQQALDVNQSLEAESKRLTSFDVDPLSMWNFATKHGDFVEELASEKRYVILIGTLNPESSDPLLAKLGSAFRPRKVRLAMDRDSGLPIELEILEDARQGKLRVRYLAWRVGELPPKKFQYQPPVGVEVVKLAPQSEVEQG